MLKITLTIKGDTKESVKVKISGDTDEKFNKATKTEKICYINLYDEIEEILRNKTKKGE